MVGWFVVLSGVLGVYFLSRWSVEPAAKRVRAFASSGNVRLNFRIARSQGAQEPRGWPVGFPAWQALADDSGHVPWDGLGVARGTRTDWLT